MTRIRFPCRRGVSPLVALLLPVACTPSASLPRGLAAMGGHPAQAHELELFGRFVGDWECEITWYPEDEPTRTETGTWHFAWVLEGRAIQDVWRVPSMGAPVGYGTTLRLFDPTIGAWRATWHGVLNGTVMQFIARQEGSEIVMELQDADVPSRWIFSDVKADSFRWRAVESFDQGKNWKTLQEMRVRRQRVDGKRRSMRPIVVPALYTSPPRKVDWYLNVPSFGDGMFLPPTTLDGLPNQVG